MPTARTQFLFQAAFDPASNRVPLPQANQNTSQDIHPKTKRPTTLISQGKLITYSYDIHGNIKTKTETPLNPKTNEPIYQSDNGLIGYKKSIQFNYNANNEPSTIIVIEDTGLEVTKTTTNYFYDAFGRRIAKTSKIEQLNKLNQRGELVKHPTALLHLRKTDKTEHSTTLMLWEGNRQIQEYTDNFVFTTVYDQDSFEPVARIVQVRNPSNKQPHSSNDEHLKNVENTETFKVYHYHNNHLGTPQELTDENGEVVWCNYEWAWGGRYTHYYTTQSLNGCAILEHELQPIRFQGQFYDVETGLHYNRFRYYDSDVGMFIQRDPIGLLGGYNVYQYAPNPVGWIDPWGLSKECNLNSCINLKWDNPKSKPTFGHTFTDHGQKVSLESLKDRARNKGHQIGQFLDDKVAAIEIAKIAKNKGVGVWDVALPSSVKTRVVDQIGNEIIADKMRIVVKPSGAVRTAFPFNSSMLN